MILRRNSFRVFAGALVAGALVHVGTVVPTVARMARDMPREGAYIVAAYAVSAGVALLACALALLLLWKAVQRPAGRVLTLFLGFLAIFWGSLFRFLRIESAVDSISINLSYEGDWVSGTAMLSFLLAVAAYVRFSALFPEPLSADRLGPVKRLHWLRRARVALLRPIPVWALVLTAFAVFQAVPEVAARMMGIPDAPTPEAMRVFVIVNLSIGALTYLLAPLLAFVLGARNLHASYRSVSREERKRTLWVVAGFSGATWMIFAAIVLLLVMVVASLDSTLLSALAPLLLFGAPLVAVAGAAVGVLYNGAIDPALALQKSTVWGALGAIAIVAFPGLENLLSEVIDERLGLPGLLGPLISGALVAAVLVPLRKVIGRRFAAKQPTSSADASEQSPAAHAPPTA